ncbi:MAG: ankyrin repeat domain-containing protein [Bacteroidales bacterium]|nr:ankyrin repeat domain-containing protein [Bacteroidales bacterium]
MKVLQILSLLILVSFSVFSQSNDKLLVQAAYDGDEATVISLLNKGANPNTVDDNGYTPLIYACAYGYQGIMKALIDKGANVKGKYNNVHPMFAAVNNDNPTSIQMLIDAGAYVNCKDDNDYTPLMYAAQEGYVKSVDYLLKNGAKVDAEDTDGHTALSIAVQNGHSDVVKTILKYNPKKSGYSSQVHSPLNTADYLHKSDEKKILKDYGMKKKYGAPGFEYLFGGAGGEISGYDFLACYQAGIHENVYNFDIIGGYSSEYNKVDLPFNSSTTTYSATNNIFLQLNKNFNIYSLNKAFLGFSVGGFGASYYGENSASQTKTQILYGVNPSIYYRSTVFLVKFEYKRALNTTSYFAINRFALSVFMRLYSFKGSGAKYIYGDKTLMMI